MPRISNNKKGAKGNGTVRKVTVTRQGKKYSYWQARFTTGYDIGTGQQIQRSFSGKTQKEVMEKMNLALAEKAEGTYMAPSKLTVGEWLDTWQAEYLGGISVGSADLYKYFIKKYIKPNLEKATLSDLNNATIQQFCNKLSKPSKKAGKTRSPLSPKTVKNIHGVLHSALEQAVDNGYIKKNPADKTKLPKPSPKRKPPLEEKQILSFLEEIQGHIHEYLYSVALFSGMREGELLGLTWDNVQFSNNSVNVVQQRQRRKVTGGEYYIAEPKYGKYRTVYLAPSVMDMLRLQKNKQFELEKKLGAQWQKSDFVFTTNRGGPLSNRSAYQCFKRIVARCGIPECRFHDLRHAYTIMALKAGDDPKTVQENLGHATAEFTLNVYAYVTRQMQQDSASRMEGYMERLGDTMSEKKVLDDIRASTESYKG